MREDTALGRRVWRLLPSKCGAWMMLGGLLILLLAACAGPRRGGPASFNNPLLEADGADPWMVFYDGNYYLTATQWSSIRMWKSPTVAGLKNVEPVTIWSDATPSRCCNVWAPEFFLLEGPSGPRWYVYYTAGTDGTLDNQRMHVLESAGADPLGPYTYKSRIFDPQNDTWAIDGSVLKMPDGKLYFLFSSWVGPNQTLFIAPMSDPWTISGRRVAISSPTLDWEKAQGNVNEGPEALYNDGKIFIVYSASACWGPDYKLGMLTYNGGAVLEPASWVKHPEPVFQRSDENGVDAPGHNGFVTSPDGKESLIVYHATAAATDGCTGVRTTRVQKFTWNEDGTPNFGVPVSPETTVTPPSGEWGMTPPPADLIYYTVAGAESGQCLAPTGGSGGIGQAACGGEAQQWALEYLGNRYYRLLNRGTGKVLAAGGDTNATQDGAQVQQVDWTHAAGQQWRLLPAADGWLRIEARQGGKYLEIGACGTEAGVDARLWSRRDTSCQLFRLQPAREVKILNVNSSKPLAVEKGSTADGANVVLWSNAETQDQRWSFVHQDRGYYQVKAGHSDKCLAVTGDAQANGAGVDQASCSGDASQQWQIEPLGDGFVRFLSRAGGKALDVSNCRMADGTNVQQWAWMDNPCQRFRFVVP